MYMKSSNLSSHKKFMSPSLRKSGWDSVSRVEKMYILRKGYQIKQLKETPKAEESSRLELID